MQHSQNKESPVIRFGFDDDSAMKVENVKILFKDGETWDMKQGQENTKFDRVTILKNCDEIYITFFVNDNELKSELYISMDHVRSVMVNHFLKEEKKVETS